MGLMNLEYALVGDVSWQTEASWQTPDTPFMSFAFWQALSETGAIGETAGWLPIFVVIYRHHETNEYSRLDASADDQTVIDNSTDQGVLKNTHNYDYDHDRDRDRDNYNNNSKASQQQPIAVMPVFVKGHHQGEFVFDYSWAQAYAQYGLDYYPRLVTSVPYTPISGQRLWLAEGIQLDNDIIKAAMAGVDDIAQQVGASSWHGLFVEPKLASLSASTDEQIDNIIAMQMIDSDAATLNQNKGAGLPTQSSELAIMERQGCQFLWQNKNLTHDGQSFNDFEDFLATLKAKKRKTIRAERRKVAEQEITCQRKCGDEISEADWKAFYHCYVMTYAVRGQQPYLTLAFFTKLAGTMPEHLMLALASDSSGEIIASSLFLYDKPNSEHSTLYGRYWGALADYDSLHFELCYYQGIEFAIEQGLTHFDPGTQGEHKLIRGFIPTTTHSLHRIYDKRFIPAISDFCSQDRLRMAQYRQQAHQALPFNADNMPDFDASI